jgi:hypothetical protein
MHAPYNTIYTYILLNGSTYAGRVFYDFRTLKGRGKMCEPRKMLGRICLSNHSIKFLLYDKPEKIDFHVFFGRICIYIYKRQIISNETRTTTKLKSHDLHIRDLIRWHCDNGDGNLITLT